MKSSSGLDLHSTRSRETSDDKSNTNDYHGNNKASKTNSDGKLNKLALVCF